MKRIFIFFGLLAIECAPTSLFGVIKLARLQASAPELLAQSHARVIVPAPLPAPAPAPVVAPAPAVAANPWEDLQELMESAELLRPFAWDLLGIVTSATPAEATHTLLTCLLNKTGLSSTDPLVLLVLAKLNLL